MARIVKSSSGLESLVTDTAAAVSVHAVKEALRDLVYTEDSYRFWSMGDVEDLEKMTAFLRRELVQHRSTTYGRLSRRAKGKGKKECKQKGSSR